MGTQDYLTASDVAEMLKVSEKSVYRWAASDPTMPALRIGGTVRFNRERLERWLRGREQGPGRHQTRDLLLSDPKSAPDKGSA